MDAERNVFIRGDWNIPPSSSTLSPLTIIDESSRDSGFESPLVEKIMADTPSRATPESGNTSGLNFQLSRRTLDFFAAIDKENNPDAENSEDLVFPLLMSPVNEKKRSSPADVSFDGFDSPLSHKKSRKEDFFASPLNRRRKSRFRKHISMPCTQMSPAASSDTQEIRIKDALERMDDEMSLIGDGSTSHVLPTINGKNSDLVSISHETMADVLNGVYEDTVQDYTVIDCRYPYEYEGGHVKGALNLYTHQQISDFIKSQQQRETTDSHRHILVFHCEFSSERGPKLLRYLRSMDRKENSHRYPYLSFPEIYILEKGYKVFSENQMPLCEPKGYTPMLHKDYSADLRRFRIRSKSWTAGERKSKIRRSLMSPY